MIDARPKHKPNEKHTLDEVLKSLKDLVHGEVLDRRPPPPPTKTSESAPPMADMRDIINSLEDLLESDLDPEEKVGRAKAALAPVVETHADKPKPRAITPPARSAPAPDARHPKPTPPPAAPEPPPARPAVPPPPVMPMFDDDLVFDIDAAPTDAPAPLAFPEEMSDDDIAKALAEIQTEMEVAPSAQPEPEPEIIDAAPPPAEPAPPLALSNEESPELTQGDLSLEPTAQDDMPDAGGLLLVEEEIAAAPAPDAASSTDEHPTSDPSLGAPADDDFNIDFAPRRPPQETKPQHVEDLAPPPWQEDDTGIDFAESTAPSADAGGSLGESVDLDLSIFDAVGDAAPSVDTVAELAPETDAIATENVAPPTPAEPEIVAPPPPAAKELAIVEPAAPTVPKSKPAKTNAPPTARPKAPAAVPGREIPVLKNVAVVSSPPAAPESFTLELTPTTPPKPALSQDLHQMAVRVIAKLNIELRKAGKPPLDAKTINRLQQLLKEALGQPK